MFFLFLLEEDFRAPWHRIVAVKRRLKEMRKRGGGSALAFGCRVFHVPIRAETLKTSEKLHIRMGRL